ncbi:hypothetical protein MTR_5g069090 [Medicago truncatula]|uniref:Uncharacterized protein n=1 Tax=Medicago truncatula TaxID=3880 RepID=G7K697_MEDTR|nr:hypothetical protein MTR_5g069090 [Medicago truncatula]
MKLIRQRRMMSAWTLHLNAQVGVQKRWIINVIYDKPTQSFILEKNNASAECSDSLNIPTERVGNCTPAKRLSAEKYQGDIASDAYNPTQLSSTKLVKHIKKERLTFSLYAFLKTCHRVLQSYLTCMCN